MGTTWTVVVAASLSLVACGGKKEGDAGKGSDLTQPAKPAPGPGAFEKLEVTLDGVRVPVETAIAKALPDGRLQLYLSPKKVVTCKELLVNVFNDKTLDSVLVDLVARLGADGKDTYTTGDLYMGTPNATDAGGKATVGGAPTKDAKVDVTLDFTGTTGFEKKKLVVKGAVAVTGCGAQDTTTGPGVSTTPAPSTAVATVAGRAFPIKGAIRKGGEIELTDFPRDCNGAWFSGVRVTQKASGWTLAGKRFDGEVTQAPPAPAGSGSAGSGSAGSGSAGSGSGTTVTAPGPAGLAITAGKTTPGVGSGSAATDATVELAVTGEGKIGDFAVKLEGTVTALDCK